MANGNMIQQQAPQFQPVSQMQLLRQGQRPQTALRNRPGAFSTFTQQVGPPPVPTKWEFYRDALTEDFMPSYRGSNKRYFNKLKRNPLKAAFVALSSALLALPMIAFYGQETKGGLFGHNHVRYLFAISLLAYPIYHANKTFPKLEEAYEQVQQGNPTQGRETFRQALSQAIYKIYHTFLKPLTFAGTAAFLFHLPKLMPYTQYRTQGWLIEPLIRNVARMLGKKRHGPIFSRMDTTSNFIQKKGNDFEQALLRKLPVLGTFRQ